MRTSVERTFAVLGDVQRKAVVDLLSRQPQRAGEIARELDLSPQALSRHLRVLRRSGLIVQEGIEQDARVRVYSLRRKPFEQMRGWLDGVERFWSGQLDSFAQHVERRRRA